MLDTNKKPGVVDQGMIRVIQTPEGEWPRWVRRGWVGTFLQCCPLMTYSRGVWYVNVPQHEALEVLDDSSHDAWLWWMDHPELFVGRNEYFSFRKEEIEIVSGFILPERLQLWNELDGSPHR